MSFSFSNRDEWMKALTNAVEGAEQSVVDAAEEVNTLVVLKTIEYTPTKSGRLASSRRAYIERDRDQISAIVSYNEDGSAPYAIEQHETAEYSHDKPWNPQNAQYRFLARAYEDEVSNIRRVFKNEVKFR